MLVGIMLNSNIILTKFWTFFVLIIKDININIICQEKCFVSFGIFRKNFSEKGFSYTVIMFLEWLSIILIDRDSISSQFIFRSSRILCRSESRIYIAIPRSLFFGIVIINPCLGKTNYTKANIYRIIECFQGKMF